MCIIRHSFHPDLWYSSEEVSVMKKSNEWKETNTIDIKRIITEEIAHFVARADQADGIKRWRTPLVGFADVHLLKFGI